MKIWLHTLALALMLSSGAATAQSNTLEQKVLRAYGYDDDILLAAKLRDVHAVMAQFNCGAAMTQKACTETNRHFVAELTDDLPRVRADMLRYLERKHGGLRPALREGRTGRASKDCGGAATLSCKTLVDFFFAGGVIDQLKAARAKAARQTKPFYKDGRPFKG